MTGTQKQYWNPLLLVLLVRQGYILFSVIYTSYFSFVRILLVGVRMTVVYRGLLEETLYNHFCRRII